MANNDCKLCHRAESIGSHIIPKWVYERMTTRDGGVISPVLIENMFDASQKQKQIKAAILCRDCDNQIFGPYDNAAAEIAPSKTGKSPPIVDFLLENPTEGVSPDLSIFLSDKARRSIGAFIAAVVWRYSHHPIGAGVCKIGKYQAPLGDWLKQPYDGVPPWLAVLPVFSYPHPSAPPIDRLVTFPVTQRPQGFAYHRHAIFFFGWFFEVLIGNGITPQHHSISLLGPHARVLRIPTNKIAYIQTITQQIKDSNLRIVKMR